MSIPSSVPSGRSGIGIHSTAQPAVEKRAEPRTTGTGEAVLRAYNGNLLRGDLMDLSPRGLRMRYVGKRMKVGSEVEVLSPWERVRATVAWTIRSGEWIQAGLTVSPPPTDDDENN